jgi:hypothetical protein
MIKIYLNPNANYFDPETNQSLLTDLQSYLLAEDNHYPLRGLWIVAEKAGKKLFQTKFTDCFLNIEKLDGFIIQMDKAWLEQLDKTKPELDENGELTGNDIAISNAEYYDVVINLADTAGYIKITPLNFHKLKEFFVIDGETVNVFAGEKKTELILSEYTETNPGV